MDSTDPYPKFSKSFFTPLLISMLAMASASLLIVLYHFFVLKYLMRMRRQQQLTTTGRLPPVSDTDAGVDEKVLEAIPVLPYSAENHRLFRVDQKECAVCLGELEEGEMVRLLPNCMHSFHVICIDRWLMGYGSCPLCRSPVAAAVAPPSGAEEPIGPRELQNPENASSASGSDRDQCGLLRHCASLVLPTEGRRRQFITSGFKRSLSMDQSFIVLELQKERERSCSSSPSTSSIRSCRDGYTRHLDRVSTKLLMSFSRLKMGRYGDQGNKNPLPY